MIIIPTNEFHLSCQNLIKSFENCFCFVEPLFNKYFIIVIFFVLVFSFQKIVEIYFNQVFLFICIFLLFLFLFVCCQENILFLRLFFVLVFILILFVFLLFFFVNFFFMFFFVFVFVFRNYTNNYIVSLCIIYKLKNIYASISSFFFFQCVLSCCCCCCWCVFCGNSIRFSLGN